jgi:hypothetical protein
MLPFIPLGTFCLPAELLKKAALRKEAYPLDYAYSSLPLIRQLLGTSFEKLLDPRYLQHYEADRGTGLACTGHRLFGGRMFLHHDLSDKDLYARFCVRRERLLQRLRDGCVCVSMVNLCENTSVDTLAEFREILALLRLYNPRNQLLAFELKEAWMGDAISVHSVRPGFDYVKVVSAVTRLNSSYITTGGELYSKGLEHWLISYLVQKAQAVAAESASSASLLCPVN